MSSVLQPWVQELPFMQQSVLISAVRGPDGISKYHKCKSLIKWYRRCILVSAFDNKILDNPYHEGGGSFTGPSLNNPNHPVPWEIRMEKIVSDFLVSRDELPFHYFTHFVHACEVLGYKHPDQRIKSFWGLVYARMCKCMHMNLETECDMDCRLGDKLEIWNKYSDESGPCSE